MHTAAVTTLGIDEPRIGPEAQSGEMEAKPQTSVAVVGILVTILIFLLVQTAGIAFWAGTQSSKQDATVMQIQEMKTQITYFQAQMQVLTTKIAAMEAASNKGGK